MAAEYYGLHCAISTIVLQMCKVVQLISQWCAHDNYHPSNVLLMAQQVITSSRAGKRQRKCICASSLSFSLFFQLAQNTMNYHSFRRDTTSRSVMSSLSTRTAVAVATANFGVSVLETEETRVERVCRTVKKIPWCTPVIISPLLLPKSCLLNRRHWLADKESKLMLMQTVKQKEWHFVISLPTTCLTA